MMTLVNYLNRFAARSAALAAFFVVSFPQTFEASAGESLQCPIQVNVIGGDIGEVKSWIDKDGRRQDTWYQVDHRILNDKGYTITDWKSPYGLIDIELSSVGRSWGAKGGATISWRENHQVIASATGLAWNLPGKKHPAYIRAKLNALSDLPSCEKLSKDLQTAP